MDTMTNKILCINVYFQNIYIFVIITYDKLLSGLYLNNNKT